MSHSSVLLLVLISIFASVLAQSSNYDCTKRPRFNPNEIKNCCKRPTLVIDRFRRACYNTTTAQSNSQAYMDPCGVECVFTKSGSLINGAFNYANLQTLLKTVMPNDPDLVRVFLAGFRFCAPDIQAKMKAYENRKIKLPNASSCSPMAVTASFCAMRYVFTNCPSNLWTSSDMCNQTQTYLKNCDPMSMSPARVPIG